MSDAPNSAPKRTLREEDFTLGNLWFTGKGNDDPELSGAVIYEYARDCRKLRTWATIESYFKPRAKPMTPMTIGKPSDVTDVEGARQDKHDKFSTHDHQEIARQIQSHWLQPELGQEQRRGPYPFLWALRDQLANDTPWLLIPPERRRAAFEAGPWSAPLYSLSSIWPVILIPAMRCEAEGLKPKVFEDWGTSHWGKAETIVFKVDWAGSTNAELAAALAFWRPPSIPEPARETTEPRGHKAPDHLGGILKSNDYRSALKHLMVLRLADQYPESEARDKAAEKLSISRDRRDDYFGCIDAARETFHSTCGWLDPDGPISARAVTTYKAAP